MNKSILFITAAALTASLLASCGGDNTRLARDIEGTWQGTPTAVASTQPGIITMTDTWTFVGDDANATGGSLVITSLSSVEWPLSYTGDTVAVQADPYAVTMAASVSLNGTWDLDPQDPDDEIIVSIDPRSLSVNIDPDAVAASTNGNPVALDTIPPVIYGAARAELTKAVQTRFFPISHLDDVKIEGRTLKFEIPATVEDGQEIKITLNRQGPVSK